VQVAIPLEQCWHQVPGGTARASIDTVAALDARPDVKVVGIAARHRRLPAPPWRPPVPVRHLPLPRTVLYEAWHGLRRPAVDRWAGPVDVLHVLGGAVAASRAPMVATLHDLAFLHHPEMFTRHGTRFFERALAIVRSEAARVLVPSSATLEDCVSAGIDRQRLRYVPWGVEVGEVPAAEVDAARRELGITGRHVVAVGTLEPRKNLRRLVDAWGMVAGGPDRDDVTLVLVGPEGWGEAVDADLPRGVVVTGFVPDRTRDALYAGATASVYPSLMEGFGLPVLESMALGCPVVTSAGTATEELVAGGAGLTVDPEDVGSIAGGIGRLLDDEDLRRRVRRAGIERARAYTWARTADLTVQAYREVVGG
jgi:glycosyltransferase involved in cell wall biosynthesis